MDPITIAMGLAQFVPQIAKWITGSDKAENIAQKAVDIATQVTGQSTGDAALKALQADPNLVLQYRQAVLKQEVDFETLAVQNAADINKTMQSEDASEHWPTYAWRPFIGFAVGFNTAVSSILILMVYTPTMLGYPSSAAAIAGLPLILGSLAAVNGTVLPILGIASWFRGKMQADPSILTNNKG